MGSTPNYAIPYPEPTEPVRDGAIAMRSLAERVAIVLAATGGGGGRGIRSNSSVVVTGSNGEAVVPISPAFVANMPDGNGSHVVAMNGDAIGTTFIIGAHAPQQWTGQWTVVVRNHDGTILVGATVRIDWIAVGMVA